MEVTIVESTAVASAGAVLARRDGRTVIVVDPALSDTDRTALIKELLGD